MRRLPLRSPPRVRGKERLLPEKHTSSGITPAYAGKRCTRRPVQRMQRDHPRVCGEKVCGIWLKCASLGSPPRVRGKETLPEFLHVLIGITPACAGKRDCHGRWRAYIKDHPRVCGEKPALPPGVLAPPGSPPRMRGKDFCQCHYKNSPGITPAYAGKSPASPPSRPSARDHPRVCGEKGLESFSSTATVGSPPRMRGKVYGVDDLTMG